MNVVIRVDASIRIGSGHVMRCLTLAGALREVGANITFACRNLPGHMIDLVESGGYRVIRLAPPGHSAASGTLIHSSWLGVSQEEDARETQKSLEASQKCDWLVVDHYALDASWETAMRRFATNIVVIDDLADRRHDCDLLLDQNLTLGALRPYDELVDPKCKQLLGPHYALLRAEFSEQRSSLHRQHEIVRRVLIFFGGTDARNDTGKAIEALLALGRPDIEVDIVLGRTNAHRDELIDRYKTAKNLHFHFDVVNMAQFVAVADLAMGAGGVAMWERCSLGLPTVVLSVAENQRTGSSAAARVGAILYLGDSQAVRNEELTGALKFLASSPNTLRGMSESGFALVDAKGTSRVVRRMVIAPIALRRAVAGDAESVYAWRNDPKTRRHSGDGAVIPFDEHLAWFKQSISNQDRAILIAERGGIPLGVLRYDREKQRAIVSVYLVPDAHGDGLGAILIGEGSRWVELNWPDISHIDAHVQKENFASVAAFQEAGFRSRYRTFTRPIRIGQCKSAIE